MEKVFSGIRNLKMDFSHPRSCLFAVFRPFFLTGPTLLIPSQTTVVLFKLLRVGSLIFFASGQVKSCSRPIEHHPRGGARDFLVPVWGRSGRNGFSPVLACSILFVIWFLMLEFKGKAALKGGVSDSIFR